MNETVMNADVVIAGGGPNGLLLACELALAGVQPLVLERLPEPSDEPKANGMGGQVVRVLDCRGLYERFSGHPGPPEPVPWYFFAAFPLELATLEHNPFYVLPVPQPRMVRLLEERARELGVRIRRGHQLTELSQDDNGVTIDVQAPDGGYQLRTRFLVGADGGHSVVRKHAGIAFPGVTMTDTISRVGHVTLPESMLIRATGELDVPELGRLPFGFTRTETGGFAFAEIEPGRPIVGATEWGRSEPLDEDTPMTLDELGDSVRRVLGVELPIGPPSGPGPHMLRRMCGQNTRQAETYRRGRVLLVGDAAHVHSSMGGPGLNLGMQDAVNLGWKLAAEIQGWAPAGLLDSYEAERYPVGERVAMHTQAQSALMAPGGEVTALRELFAELLRDKETLAHIADLLAGSDVRYPMPGPDGEEVHPLVGRFAPDLPLRTANGVTRVAEVLRAARPVLVLLDVERQARLVEIAYRWTDRIQVVAAESTESTGATEPSAAALLIRPDGYVAWAMSAGEPDVDDRTGLESALTTWFGVPATVPVQA